jgi:hypothetical protein
MKHTCTKCGRTDNVPERDILAYIERSTAFAARVRKLIARLNSAKGHQSMTAEQRRARAKKAVAAREAKRAEKGKSGENQKPKQTHRTAKT